MISQWSVVQTLVVFVLASFLGMFVAQIIAKHRSTYRALSFVRPLIRCSNLPDKLSLPAAIGIIDFRSEHAIVSSLLKRGELNEREVLVYNLTASPLRFVCTSLRYLIPIAVAPLGPLAGGMYVVIIFIRSLIALPMGIAWGRLSLRPRGLLDAEVRAQDVGDGDRISREDVIKAARSALSMTIYFLKRYAVVLAVLIVLDYLNAFSYMAAAMMQIAPWMPLTPQMLLIVTAHIVSPPSGFVAAGELLRQGAISVRDALTALVIGSFLFLLLFDIARHSFPIYVTLYPVRTALKLSLLLIATSAAALPVQLAVISLIP